VRKGVRNVSGNLDGNPEIERPRVMLSNICEVTIIFSGPGCSVGIATGYGLDGKGIESRWWLWGQPSLLYIRYRVFAGGRKQLRHDANPSALSSAEVQKTE
jgi:hypothetical protein